MSDGWKRHGPPEKAPQTVQVTVAARPENLLWLGGDDHGGDPEPAQPRYVIEPIDIATVESDRRLRQPVPLTKYRPDEANFLNAEARRFRLPYQLLRPIVAGSEP